MVQKPCKDPANAVLAVFGGERAPDQAARLRCARVLQYGRAALPEVTREIDGKSEEEVRAYSKTFWKRYKELADWERVIKNIGARRLPLSFA